MSPGFTAQAARNIFYGGTLFFVLVFAALILHHRDPHPRAIQVGRDHTAVERGNASGRRATALAATPAW